MQNIDLLANRHIKGGLYLKPEFLNHESVSGNKYRKLKYNLKEAKQKKYQVILTFGGAYSNHIAAVAAAGKIFNFKTIGIIRGEELASSESMNPSLKFANECGMHLEYVSRDWYREKDTQAFKESLIAQFGDFYSIPEGGTNLLAVKGCEEILTDDDHQFEYICCPVGTGGTIAGIINSSFKHQKIIGFPVLKGDFLKEDIAKFAKGDNWELISDYHFGGYAKINEELISFINQFKADYNIQLDPVYTGKMMYGIFDMIKTKKIAVASKILAIHTGGLQGIVGMNMKLRNKNLPELI